jgi:hypothetical protein
MDLLPDTMTARLLRTTLDEPDATAVEARTPDDPKRYREVPIDPDDPNAPHCSGKKHIVIDPDDPDAPFCKPKRYIKAPDTAPSGVRAETLPDWARGLGDDLAERFR